MRSRSSPATTQPGQLPDPQTTVGGDQDDEEPGPVVSSTSDATSGTRVEEQQHAGVPLRRVQQAAASQPTVISNDDDGGYGGGPNTASYNYLTRNAKRLYGLVERIFDIHSIGALGVKYVNFNGRIASRAAARSPTRVL
jgi:hypothetical protein